MDCTAFNLARRRAAALAEAEKPAEPADGPPELSEPTADPDVQPEADSAPEALLGAPAADSEPPAQPKKRRRRGATSKES